ncbi:hypothetical protein Desru_1107 [Desulforamulus ruminis DSM 2154]|uniref:Uncharacterized protein n=1 Tax=Desulforamulus ruminis (strain ATCC 23193 / DSM 2154 / NCIMB 8452 / DL) TaxID=696281 RepID=F6DM40_DESRL|nr:hypothetical protein Desru_1107 [Desulforamulus ruminis DSM 2154]
MISKYENSSLFREILHYLSIIFGFLMVWSPIAILFAVVTSLIPGVWEVKVYGLSLAPWLISVVACWITLNYCTFRSPYKK